MQNLEFYPNRVSKPEKKTRINLQQLQETKYPKLSMKSFFEFLRTAYQVNDSFEQVANTLSLNSEINWNSLAKTALNPTKNENVDHDETDTSKNVL